jgi:uncharacterized Zn-binding protein involved in type VI secretion
MAFDKIFESNEFDNICRTLYGDFSHKRKEAYKSLFDMHVKGHGCAPDSFYSASGRIEIVGNHTDHNGGKVLCSAVTIDTLGAVSKRDDGMILVKSKGYPIIKVSVDDIAFKVGEVGTSQAIIKGIVAYFKGAGVYFDNVNKIFVKLSTTENVTLTINGVEVAIEGTTVYTDGILATEFAETFTFALYHDGVLMQTLTYSVNAYAYAKQADAAMGELALALDRYGVSASAYKA